jgi:hypothetical protein
MDLSKLTDEELATLESLHDRARALPSTPSVAARLPAGTTITTTGEPVQ